MPITLYTPAARQQSRKQHARVCGNLSELYCCGFLLFFPDRAICIIGGLRCCVIHACCHRYNTAAAAVRLSWAAECSRESQSFLRSIIVNFCKYSPTTVLEQCRVPCVTRACGLCGVSRVDSFQTFFFTAVLVLFAGEAFFAARGTTKIPGMH